MERKDNNEVSSLILNLALKTLQNAVIFGALLIVLIFMLFPSVPEDFYASAGNGVLSYAFAVKATDENSSTDRIIKTADKALSLAERNSEYNAEAEKYLKALLSKGDVVAAVEKIDKRNLAEAPKVLHVNLCDSIDYYTVCLYRLRLKRNCTTLFIAGADCEIIRLDEKLNSLDNKEKAYLFDQLSYYVDYCIENSAANKLETFGIEDYYAAALDGVANKIDVPDPALSDLFELKALYKFSTSYTLAGGKLGFTESIEEYDNIKELYEDCLKNYCKLKRQEAIYE